MPPPSPPNSHRSIRDALLQRIQSGEWGLGELIPGEVALAAEYGCARATVNRALRSLADEGLLERKRKGGTRIRPLPIRLAIFNIPVIREEVQSSGGIYAHQLVARIQKAPPRSIRARLRLGSGIKALYLETLHLIDSHAYAFEVRWVNIAAVPGILSAPLDVISANEWLVKTVPFSSGDLMFSAINADHTIAHALQTREGAAVLVTNRTTWQGENFITTTRLYYKAGYELCSRL